MPDRRALDLIEFIDASPSPFHACATVAARLERAGFQRLDESAPWTAAHGSFYAIRSASIVAWTTPAELAPHASFRVIGAHTDSPNLRIKPKPNTGAAGVRQLGVEVYGGVLLNSWLDRDLGLSGRVALRGTRSALVQIDRPILRIPQLAIHLDREVNERGLVLDRQQHLAPMWSLGRPDEQLLQKVLALELKCEPRDVLAWDLMCHDVQGGSLLGLAQEFVSSPRIDNLCSCYCGLEALVAARERKPDATLVLCLFDHEEIGSQSHRGAASPILKDVLERSVLARGGTRDDFHRAIAASICASVDMAHATHPNYRERHEPDHWIALNAGPVIKINTTMRYASDALGEAAFQGACERAGVPYQKYVHRSNLACGTTIGPLTAANLGIATVDVGNPQLSMHSCRELCGAHDPAHMVGALTELLARG
jgi:aspartyl aminopeptidase